MDSPHKGPVTWKAFPCISMRCYHHVFCLNHCKLYFVITACICVGWCVLRKDAVKHSNTDIQLHVYIHVHIHTHIYIHTFIYSLAQDCNISSALAIDLLQSCAKSLIYRYTSCNIIIITCNIIHEIWTSKLCIPDYLWYSFFVLLCYQNRFLVDMTRRY